MVDFIDFPAGGETRRHIGRLVGVFEVPVDERVKRGVAEETESFAAVVGDAAGRRDVGGGHADPHNFVG